MTDIEVVAISRMTRYAIVKERLLRTKEGGAAEPLSMRYSSPAGGCWPKNAIFLGGARRGEEAGIGGGGVGERGEMGHEGLGSRPRDAAGAAR